MGKATIEELQTRALTMNEHKTSRESVLLEREIAKQETKIEALNDDNLKLADQHRQERARLLDNQARLRTLGKRERELAKHLAFLVEQLTEASKNACEIGGPHDGCQPVDFASIPGLCLEKLLAPLKQQPPTVMATEAVRGDPQESQQCSDPRPADDALQPS